MRSRALGAALVALGAALALTVLAGRGAREARAKRGPSAVAAEADRAPRMLELYAPWCSLCAGMKPVVEDLSARCADKGVRIDAIDISQGDNEAVAKRYDVRAVPTFLFLDANGVETGRLVGARTEQELAQGLETLGGVSCADKEG